MRTFILLGLVALAAAAVAVGTASADNDSGDSGGTHTWRVTITNLTPPIAGGPGSQPLSPPLFVVHSNKADVWGVGEIASHGVAAIAEDANNAPLESALPTLEGVKSVATGAGGANLFRGDALVHRPDLRRVQPALGPDHAGQHERRLHRTRLRPSARQRVDVRDNGVRRWQ